MRAKTTDHTIHIYEDVILKVVTSTNKYYVGFDILTETPCQKLKTTPFSVLGESIKKLLNNEVFRFKLATQIDNSLKGTCAIMGHSHSKIIELRNLYYKHYESVQK